MHSIEGNKRDTGSAGGSIGDMKERCHGGDVPGVVLEG